MALLYKVDKWEPSEVLDARNLGVGGRPGEVDGAQVCGFGVACPACVRGVRGDRLKEIDVSVISSADGRWDGTRGIDDGASELAVRLAVVIGFVGRPDDGLRHGCFDSALRGNAGGSAHGATVVAMTLAF